LIEEKKIYEERKEKMVHYAAVNLLIPLVNLSIAA